MKKNQIALCFLAGLLVAASLFFWLGMGEQQEAQESFESNLYLEDYRKVAQLKLSDFEPSDPVALSEWVADFRVVKLDASVPEALLGDYTQLFLSDNYIGVTQSGEKFKLFDKKSGKFLRMIGNIGRGPGEYSATIYDAVFDEPNDRIYLNPFAESRLLEYSLQGDFIKTIAPKIGDRKAKFTLADSVFTLFILPFPSDSLMAYRFGFDGRIISAHPNRIGGKKTFDYDLLSLVNGDHVGYFALSSPVYYHYDIARDSLYPRFAIDQEDMAKNDYSVNVLESKESYWISVLKVGKRFDAGKMVDKLGATGEYLMMNMDGEQKRKVRIYNDYFFNIPVEITWYSPTQGVYFQNFSALELKHLLQQTIERNELNAEQKHKAIAFERSIGEDDNNYVFYGRLIK